MKLALYIIRYLLFFLAICPHKTFGTASENITPIKYKKGLKEDSVPQQSSTPKELVQFTFAAGLLLYTGYTLYSANFVHSDNSANIKLAYNLSAVATFGGSMYFLDRATSKQTPHQSIKLSSMCMLTSTVAVFLGYLNDKFTE